LAVASLQTPQQMTAPAATAPVVRDLAGILNLHLETKAAYFAEHQLVAVGWHLLQALANLHGAGRVHGDICLQTAVVLEPGIIGGSGGGSVVGLLERPAAAIIQLNRFDLHSPPEIRNGTEATVKADARHDVWQLGVLLYELMSQLDTRLAMQLRTLGQAADVQVYRDVLQAFEQELHDALFEPKGRLHRKYPHLAPMVTRMLDATPSGRPSVTDLIFCFGSVLTELELSH